MTGQTINRLDHAVHVRRIHDVDHRMLVDWVAMPVLQRQQDHFSEVVLGSFTLPSKIVSRCSLSSFCGFGSGPWHSRHSLFGLAARSRCALSPPCGSWHVAQPCTNAGWCKTAFFIC